MRDFNGKCIRVVGIVDGTSVDGPGLRTAIYIAGCKHHCQGCHNPDTWSFDAGEYMSLADIYEHIAEQDFDVTFSGGDPMEHAIDLAPLFAAIKEDGRNIWCYTGYTFEDVLRDPLKASLLKWIDVLVDGKFELSSRDISLRFKGSHNQRLIDVKHSDESQVTLWDDV